MLKTVLSSKAPSWKYEKEVRIIRHVAGSLEIPRTSLTQIIFGLQTSAEDESLVRSIADKYYDNLEFGKAIRTGNDFGIDVVEI